MTALLITSILALVAFAQTQVRVVVVEVRLLKQGGEIVSYYLIECNSSCQLTLPVNESVKGVVVRVDSASPIKPCGIAVDGAHIVPTLSRGVSLVEDFVWINTTRLGFTPRSVTVFFCAAEAKPLAYSLSSKRGRHWGWLVYALLSNATSLELLKALRATVTSLKPVVVPSSAGNLTLWDAQILTTERDVSQLIALISNSTVKVRVTPLYYVPFDQEAPADAEYVYVNAPAGCAIKVNGARDSREPLALAFPGNPRLLSPSPSLRIIAGPCRVQLVNEGPYDYAVGGKLVGSGGSALLALEACSLLASAYRAGVRVYDVVVHGCAPTLKLPSLAYTVRLSVLDSRGRPVDRAVAVISSTSVPVSEMTTVSRGYCEFRGVPPGSYVVSIYLGGVEVGRASLGVSRGDVSATLQVVVADLHLAVVYPSGERVYNYSVKLKCGALEYEARDSGDGVARIEGVPVGHCKYTVLRGGVPAAAGIIDVREGLNRRTVIANLSRVYVKVVDILGRPRPGATVEAKGDVTVRAVTRGDGVAILELPPGNYTLSVPELGVEAQLRVRAGGEYITISQSLGKEVVVFVVVAVVAFLVALKLTKSVGRRTGIEILDVEEMREPRFKNP